LLRVTDIKLPKDYRTLCLKQYQFNIDKPTQVPNIKEDESTYS
jgi:hypothetical protein